MEDIKNSQENTQGEGKEISPIKLSPSEQDSIRNLTRGIDHVVDTEIIEQALDDVIDTLQNGHPLNTLIINNNQEISGYLACQDFEEKVAYLKYMASNESGDISFFKEIASLLQKAQENKYHKITFHGWNKDLNDILAKRYDFVKVRTDSINGTSVDYFEKNLMTKQTPSQNQQEAFYQKNILRIQSLLEKTLASYAERNPEKIQHIQKTLNTVE